MSPLERGFYEEIVADLCARPPSLLLIESAPPRAPLGRRSLDLTAYYGQDARCQRLFAGYKRSTTLGPFVVFTRVGDASCQAPAESRPAPAGMLEWRSQAGLE
jgi:hypothetical protein